MPEPDHVSQYDYAQQLAGAAVILGLILGLILLAAIAAFIRHRRSR